MPRKAELLDRNRKNDLKFTICFKFEHSSMLTNATKQNKCDTFIISCISNMSLISCIPAQKHGKKDPND